MHEWISDKPMRKAPPPMPDKERLNGCGMAALAMTMSVLIITSGVVFLITKVIT